VSAALARFGSASHEAVFHVKHEGWAEIAGLLGIELDVPQAERLDRYEQLLRDRAIPLGMVARSDAGRLRERHIADCLRAASVVLATDRSAYDLGSGAGLPGIVVAIVRPELEIVLVESRRIRAAFLELVAGELALSNARVFSDRAERLTERVDLCFARALFGARDVWLLAERLLGPAGRLVYFAGERFDPAELPEGARAEIRSPRPLARSGPLVIMSRQ
jgi:16S rRNA (guanine527-N7)-methyltransferase